MSKSMHTPGKWVAEECFSPKENWFIRDAEGKCVLSGLGLSQEHARLMASAPELLEALKSVLDSLGALSNPSGLSGWMSKDDADKIFAALAKAGV